MGEAVSKGYVHKAMCCRQNSSSSSKHPLISGCVRVTRVTILRRPGRDGSPTARDARRRARSYEHIFKRESDFFCKTIRQPYDLGSKLLSRNCLSFDDLTNIESHDAIGAQTHVLIEVVTKKGCFVELYEILLEEESPLVDYLEIKRNSKEYVSDAEFVKKLGMRAYLTENDRKVLKKYYRFITRNTSGADDIFTHLRADGLMDDLMFEKLFHFNGGETAKMEYFVQTNMSRWTYEELKTFCDILMEDNDHVAKVLWPIVNTVDPDAGKEHMDQTCSTEDFQAYSKDSKCESTAFKIFKDNTTLRQSSVILGNHGNVSNVVTGSIKITIVLQTLTDLARLRSDVRTGCIEHRFQGWIESNSEKLDGRCVVKAALNKEEVATAEAKLSQYFDSLKQKGTLDHPVEFGFCKERGEWFWSHDGVMWTHVTRLRVPIGDEEDKVPCDNDVQVIQMLAKKHIPLERPVSPCPVCTMGKLKVDNDNIYEESRQCESLHRGVSVTVTFNVFKSPNHPDSAKSTPKHQQSPSKFASLPNEPSPNSTHSTLGSKESSTDAITQSCGKVGVDHFLASYKESQPDKLKQDSALRQDSQADQSNVRTSASRDQPVSRTDQSGVRTSFLRDDHVVSGIPSMRETSV